MNTNYANEVKIIGGTYKGKILRVNDTEGLRPTPSRVRETVFNWIGDSIAGARVLDLFAGSGALGLEAASRGAKSVTLVELDKGNCECLLSNSASFVQSDVSVINTDALNFLNSTSDVFDVVFIDPPYSLDIYKDVLKTLIKKNLITDYSLVYVEMRNGNNIVVPGFEIIRQETSGQAKYTLWKKSSLIF
ncbi:MAG: 16S rRNA (guanine(966)-N(2))-methyltransferase RsmD [Succinivibrio sp.]